jgi:hypothetical protein
VRNASNHGPGTCPPLLRRRARPGRGADQRRRRHLHKAGAETLLRIYERPRGYTTAEYTVVGFLVEDLEEEMSELRRRGVAFEEYDLPHLKTHNGVYTDERRDAKGAWIRDPDADGNILALTQLPSN